MRTGCAVYPPFWFPCVLDEDHPRTQGRSVRSGKKRRQKFSRTGERVLGCYSYWTNQFHDSFACLFLIGQVPNRRPESLTLPSGSSYTRANSTFRRTCLAHVGELFSRRVFSFQWKMHQLKKSHCRLMEGKFINTRILLGMFMRIRAVERGCSVYVTPARPTCQGRTGEISSPFKLIYANLLLVISPQWHNSIDRNWESTLAELHKQA